MVKWAKVLLCLLPCALIWACKNEPKNEIKTEKIDFTKEGELSLFSQDSLLTTFDIEVAESEYETQTGLMYRESMKENQGMLFIFSDVRYHSFYMKNTKIALDIIYIDENSKIVSFQKNTKPFDETALPSEAPVKYVLEINAGLSEKLNLVKGDSIAFKRMH